MTGNVTGTDAFDAPDVLPVDVRRAVNTSVELINEAADLLFIVQQVIAGAPMTLLDEQLVAAWFEKRDGLMNGSLR